MLKTLSPVTKCGCSNFKSKCGEIHYQTTHFSILCIGCGITSLTYTEFVDHFRSLHLDDFSNDLENVVTTEIEKNAVDRTWEDPLEIVVLESPINSQENLISKDVEQLELCQENIDADETINVVVDEKLEDFVEMCKIEAEEVDLPANENTQCEARCLYAAYNNNQIYSDSLPMTITGDVSEDESENQQSGSDISKTEEVDWSKPYAPNQLKSHEKRPYKPRNKPNICSYCGRTFRRRYQLDTHLNIHTGLKPHQCEICGKTFRAVTTLSRHRNTHDQRDDFTCRYCAKRFTHKAALLSHELRHTQERNVPCDECAKMFYTLNQLDTHKRKLHHKPDDEALAYACDLCPKRYRSASMLSTHRFKKHYKTAKFNCEQCDKKFVDEQQLKNHKLIHIDRLSSLNL